MSKHRDAGDPPSDAPAREYLTDRNIIDLYRNDVVQELDTGRPDAADRAKIRDFAEKVLWKIREGGLIYPPAFLREKTGDEPAEQGKQRENAFFIGESRFNLSSAKLVLLSAAEEAFDPAE